MALDIHDNELLCSCGCGFYAEESRSSFSDGRYEVDDSKICYARAALVRYERSGVEPEPGTMLRAFDAKVEPAPAHRQFAADDVNAAANKANTTQGGLLA